jgi:hypothetical protein
MAFTFQGIGTRFYGQREFEPDGSYITTKWFVFLYVPIIPLRSLRVIDQGAGDYKVMLPPVVMGSSVRYAVLQETSPNPPQVLSIYGFVLLCAAWFVGLMWFMRVMMDSLLPKYFSERPLAFTAIIVTVWATFIIPVLLPRILRSHAKRTKSA